MEFGQNTIADNRRIPAYPGKFNVDSPYQFGLELWKATQLFDDRQAHGAHFMPGVPPFVKLPESLIEGPNRQSLYLTSAARGETPWGETPEISANDVGGITLHEMTQWVSAILTPKYQANRALKKQEQLARKNENRSGEFDGQRPGDGQLPKPRQDQPSSASESAVSAQERAMSPVVHRNLSQEATDVLGILESTLTASTAPTVCKSPLSAPTDGSSSSRGSRMIATNTHLDLEERERLCHWE